MFGRMKKEIIMKLDSSYLTLMSDVCKVQIKKTVLCKIKNIQLVAKTINLYEKLNL